MGKRVDDAWGAPMRAVLLEDPGGAYDVGETVVVREVAPDDRERQVEPLERGEGHVPRRRTCAGDAARKAIGVRAIAVRAVQTVAIMGTCRDEFGWLKMLNGR